jgi:hypothetical protein
VLLPVPHYLPPSHYRCRRLHSGCEKTGLSIGVVVAAVWREQQLDVPREGAPEGFPAFPSRGISALWPPRGADRGQDVVLEKLVEVDIVTREDGGRGIFTGVTSRGTRGKFSLVFTEQVVIVTNTRFSRTLFRGYSQKFLDIRLSLRELLPTP